MVNWLVLARERTGYYLKLFVYPFSWARRWAGCQPETIHFDSAAGFIRRAAFTVWFCNQTVLAGQNPCSRVV